VVVVKIYVVTKQNGAFDDIVIAFKSKKKAAKYCKKHVEGYAFEKVELK
jgi:hypothetical protein